MLKHLFAIESSDAELLLTYERCGNLQATAESLGRNVSVISRRLSRLARDSALLEKRERRWVLTSRGRSLNRWTESSARDQALALRENEEFRVGAPREFCARFLVTAVHEWSGGLRSRLRFVTTDRGVEELLLERKIDLAFDCGAPYSPEIAFRKLARESFGAYFGSATARETAFRGTTKRASLKYLHYDRFDFSDVRRAYAWVREPSVVFSDIASIRMALATDPEAWTVLPDYCGTEFGAGKSRVVRAVGEALPSLHFGIWWSRAHPPSSNIIQSASAWLRRQEPKLTRSGSLV